MDEEIQQPQTQPAERLPEIEPKESRKNHSTLKKLLIGLLTLILVAASGFGAYLWRDNVANSFEKQQATDIASYKVTIAGLAKELADAKATSVVDAQTPCTEVAPIATTIDSIKASITSGNTAALEGYMATSVNVILAATEAYGPQTPTQAVADVSNFISADITSWDYNFSLPAVTLATYQAGGYSQYFPTIAVVGKATNKKVISFSFDCNGKINTVFMSADEALL